METKIDKLEADFECLDDNELDGDKRRRLVARYQTIDKVIAENMKCAANSVKSSDRGCQFSNELLIIKCSNQVKLWEEVLSRT